MPKYHVEITARAETDILEIYEYIAADNKTAAAKLVKEIEHHIDSLEKSPLRCPVIPESNELGKEYRHLIYGNYRTIITIEGKQVTIMRVIHSARLLSLALFES